MKIGATVMTMRLKTASFVSAAQQFQGYSIVVILLCKRVSLFIPHLHRHFKNMFGTLRYNSQNADSEFIGRAGDPSSCPLDDRGPRSLACDRCRSKKVGSSSKTAS